MLVDPVSAQATLRVVLRDPGAPPGAADIEMYIRGEFARHLDFIRNNVSMAPCQGSMGFLLGGICYEYGLAQ